MQLFRFFYKDQVNGRFVNRFSKNEPFDLGGQTLQADMYLWRPVLAELITYGDLSNMTITELVDCHEVLDFKEYVEELERRKNQARRK